MKCPKCDNGIIEAFTYDSTRKYHKQVVFECAVCDYCTSSLTELFEKCTEKLVDRLKGVLI